MCEQQPARARFKSSPGSLRGGRVTVLTSLSRKLLSVSCFVNQQINALCKLNRLRTCDRQFASEPGSRSNGKKTPRRAIRFEEQFVPCCGGP